MRRHEARHSHPTTPLTLKASWPEATSQNMGTQSCERGGLAHQVTVFFSSISR